MDLEKCIPHDLLRFTMIYHDWYVEMDNFFIEMMLVCVLFCRVKLIALRWNLHHFHPRNREISGFSSAWSQKTRGEDQIVPGARQQGSSPMPVGNMAISLGTSENSDTFTFEKEIVEHWDLYDIWCADEHQIGFISQKIQFMTVSWHCIWHHSAANMEQFCITSSTTRNQHQSNCTHHKGLKLINNSCPKLALFFPRTFVDQTFLWD